MRRRDLFGLAGFGLATLASPDAQRRPSRATAAPVDRDLAERLRRAVADLPVDDTHCHPISDKDAQTTPRAFLERLALAAFPAASYFPRGILQQWKAASPDERAALDRAYGIEKVLADIDYHIRQSAFLKFMVKELAAFLGCEPRLEAVLEARNARAKGGYFVYIADLFKDVKLANVMVDTGFTDGMQADGMQRFAHAIEPTTMRALARVDSLARDLLRGDLAFDELETQFLGRVRDALDGTGNYGLRSYGMKSYLLPRIGLIRPVYDRAAAARSWDDYRRTRTEPVTDRQVAALRGRELQEYLLTRAIEECLSRDMPMQFHAGDGEAPGVILRNQDPYNLEEIVRFERDGRLRLPKIITLHAGYPLVGRAAWLCHLYTNCYFDLSLMTPFIHRGLVTRYLEIMEAVPLSKILFGSDAYNLPELYWFAARWGKRFLSEALAVHVADGVLTEEEALDAARLILHENNRRIYNLPATSKTAA
jgi:predicted TIM-barrel fold metal-dependent hydrolase